MEQKKARVADVIFHNKENGYTIAIAENENEQFTAVGHFHGLPTGREFALSGNFKIHPLYGEQFVFSGYEEIMPASAEGMEGFLSSGLLKGIGKKTAQTIVKKFGAGTFDVIENDPAKLTEVDGIGAKKAEAIAAAFAAHREFAEITLYFQQFEISADYALKLYKVYGADTIDKVNENPYRLVDDVFGINFRKADRIAEKLGVSRDDEERVKSGALYVMQRHVNDGHTFLPKAVLCEKAAELMDLSTEQIYEALVQMVFDGRLHMETLEGRPVVFLLPYFVAEQNVCKKLILFNSAVLKPINADIDELISRTERQSGTVLSEKQKFAVKSSLTSGVSVITGGPGTGKTTIINTIINILQDAGLKAAIAAPTGRAAKRITETSGHHASTIHRLLEYYYSESEEAMRFGKNEEDPLEYDAVIIDEASMIDILLMNGLVNAIQPGTRLIIVGDADQLPSVGAGNVLRDIIDGELIYSVKLTEIFRQAKESLIVVNAHKINKGEYPDCNEKGKDFFLMRIASEREMLKTIKDLCVNRLPGYYEDCIPMRDIQVLTPVRKGLLGCVNLNVELQSVLNPPSAVLEEKKFADKIFRENDKVMQVRNNYQLKWKKLDDFSEGQGVFNGDIGFIQKIDKEQNQATVVFDENKYVTYDFAQLDEIEPAYAITVHKSQGSEFPVVVMPISWFPPVLSTRNLLYTAVTRGKTAVVLVGSENKMNGMVDNNMITERYSGLATRLRSFLVT
ncbi:MAG: ATP-dependent RecD-like DNA helicase [Clostridiales bacterium]|nr:ATP-dependent RecD-like DNA helicase [Clostridiales bacterium]